MTVSPIRSLNTSKHRTRAWQEISHCPPQSRASGTASSPPQAKPVFKYSITLGGVALRKPRLLQMTSQASIIQGDPSQVAQLRLTTNPPDSVKKFAIKKSIIGALENAAHSNNQSMLQTN